MKDDRLIFSMNEIANLSDSDKTDIKGKKYTTVVLRLQAFRKHFGSDARIETDVIHSDLERVAVKASISVFEDREWRLLSTGLAEEFRGDNYINKTSALENCETSAIGRALACLGLGGGEYASSFEMDNAINNKAPAPEPEFVFEDTKGKKIADASDAFKYLQLCRTFLADPKAEDCRQLYDQNANTIKKGLDNALPKDVEAYEKLIEIYESQKVVN